jgi:hypothetical protein
MPRLISNRYTMFPFQAVSHESELGFVAGSVPVT